MVWDVICHVSACSTNPMALLEVPASTLVWCCVLLHCCRVSRYFWYLDSSGEQTGCMHSRSLARLQVWFVQVAAITSGRAWAICNSVHAASQCAHARPSLINAFVWVCAAMLAGASGCRPPVLASLVTEPGPLSSKLLYFWVAYTAIATGC